MVPKDLFSEHAASYAQYRPTYPRELYHYLQGLCRDRDLAWDCATGNGQAAAELANYFAKVVATDISSEQLAQAVAHPRISYRIASAEQSGLEASSVSLISVAQALHWFHHDAFFREVERVLKPGGVLAVWCYALNLVSPEFDAVVLKLYDEVLAEFWEPERRLVDQGYASIKLPFDEITPPRFAMQSVWNLGQYLNYLETWSAVRKYIKAKGRNPVRDLDKAWLKAWGNPAQKLRIYFPLYLRVAVAP